MEKQGEMFGVSGEPLGQISGFGSQGGNPPHSVGGSLNDPADQFQGYKMDDGTADEEEQFHGSMEQYSNHDRPTYRDNREMHSSEFTNSEYPNSELKSGLGGASNPIQEQPVSPQSPDYLKTERQPGEQEQPGTTHYNFRQDTYYNLESKTEGAPIGSFENVFPTENDNKPRWNDWMFTILFLLTLAAFIAIAAITLRAWAKVYSATGSGIYGNSNTGTLNTNSAILLVFVCMIALILAITGLLLCYRFPKQFIYCGMIVNIVASLGTAITYMSLRYWSAGIVFLVFTFLTAWCCWGMRSRIPLTIIILRIVVDVMKVCPQTFIVSISGSLIGSSFGLLFSTVIVATYIKWDPDPRNPGCGVSGGGCSQSQLIGMLVLVFFCGFYISEVIRNVIHVTVSGIYGSWYYMYKSDQGMPKWSAMGSLKRALTYSFGSICFGSLIVALIETLRAVIQLLRQGVMTNNSFGNCTQCAFLIFSWIISFIQWVAQYFNHYAYCFIALYGKPYLRAAKETWCMLRKKGVDALINDNLINIALVFYTMFVGYISALFAYLYLRFTTPDYNNSGGFNAPLMAFAFVIGLQICNIANETIRSGTATFFIALGNDPEVFQASYPEKFDKIFLAYPDVLNKLTHQNV